MEGLKTKTSLLCKYYFIQAYLIERTSVDTSSYSLPSSPFSNINSSGRSGLPKKINSEISAIATIS